jgi:hypothetical protein
MFAKLADDGKREPRRLAKGMISSDYRARSRAEVHHLSCPKSITPPDPARYW